MTFTERYVRSDAAGGGDGSADNSTDAWTFAEAVAAYAAGDRVNVKADATYSLGATSLATSSTGTALVHWRGYTTTIGDGGKPVLSVTGTFSLDSAKCITFESFDMTGGLAYAQILTSAGTNLIQDVCLTQTDTNGGGCFKTTGQNDILLRCVGKDVIDTTESATFSGAKSSFIACTVETLNGIGIDTGANYEGVAVIGCLVTASGAGTVGISLPRDITVGTPICLVVGNTVFGFDDGISIGAHATAADLAQLLVVNNVIYDVDNGIILAGSVRTSVRVSHNFIGLAATARYSGFGDIPLLGDVTLTADPFTDSAADDFTINNTAGGGALVRDAGLEAPDPL